MVLMSLWTTIITLFAKIPHSEVSPGMAPLEDSFMIQQVNMPTMVGFRPDQVNVPAQKNAVANSREQKNFRNTWHSQVIRSGGLR